MKLFTSIISLAMLPLLACGQEGRTTAEEFKRRIGGSEQRQEKYYTMYQMHANYCQPSAPGDSSNLRYDLGYPLWKELMLECPQISLELYTRGAQMLSGLLTQGQPDEKMCKVLFDDFIWLYDVRMDNLDVLNSYQTNPLKKATKGDMMVWKALQNALYGEKFNPDYSLVDARQLFVDALNEVAEHGGREVDRQALEMFMVVSYKLYLTDEAKYFVQYLDDYLQCEDVCYKRMATANEIIGSEDKLSISEEKRAEAVETVKNFNETIKWLEAQYKDSGLGGNEGKLMMNAEFKRLLAEHANDAPFLHRCLRLMREFECMDQPAYGEMAETAYDLKADYENAFALAYKTFGTIDYSLGDVYAQEAFDECPDKKLTGRLALVLAQRLAQRGVSEVNSAKRQAEEAKKQKKKINQEQVQAMIDRGTAKRKHGMDFIPTAEQFMGQTGEFYYQSSVVYFYAGEYLQAMTAAQTAVEKDVTYKGRVEGVLPQMEDAYNRQLAAEQARAKSAAEQARAKAAHDKAQAEYAAYLRKKAKEEEFWNGTKK